ncbi:MAG: hypothetical protein K6F61_03915 [Clostridiales bacterium]|nr:hypothetical protein [Clostridiales bacterium]
MIDAVFDPELGCTVFTVDRITYTRSREGTTSRTVTVRARGCVHPGTPEMLKLLPEEEKADQFILIYTDYALSTGVPEDTCTSAFTSPDRVHWNNQIWRVIRVRNWSAFGYCQAYAALMHEE